MGVPLETSWQTSQPNCKNILESLGGGVIFKMKSKTFPAKLVAPVPPESGWPTFTKELLKVRILRGDIRRLQGRCRPLPAPPPVFETADDKSGSNGRGSLPLPAITNHYHHRPHPFTERKLPQKLNFPTFVFSLCQWHSFAVALFLPQRQSGGATSDTLSIIPESCSIFPDE